jgi:septal ring factor EnvC (AmiA/AmiB activator)
MNHKLSPDVSFDGRMTMRTKSYLCAVAAMLAASGTLPAQTKFNEARTTLEKWVETRQLISKEKGEWQTDRQSLLDQIALLEKEQQLLTDQIAKAEATATQVDKERQRLVEENEGLSVAATAIRTSLVQLEKRVLALYKSFPPPLRERIDPLYKRVPTTSVVHLSLGERMQNVIGILSEVDKFNSAITVVNEVKKAADGKEVSVRTIYLGLGAAFYVDKTGQIAGVGAPGAEDWQWTARNDLSPKIAKLIYIYENAAAAEFVSMPISVK